MGKEFLIFGDVKIKKETLYSSKSAVDVDNLNIDKIVIFHVFPCIKRGSKYFISYHNNEVTPLCVLPPKMSGYLKNFVDAKTMSFLVEDEKLLKKYKEI